MLKGRGGMAVNQQSNIRIALAFMPNIVGETPEDAAFRCDQHGMFMCSRFGTLSENEKISSASGELREHLGFDAVENLTYT